jgi:hypothetical protein
MLDLQGVNPVLRGFNGGFVHNGRVYFVPFYTGVAAGSKLVSVDATSFSAASVQVHTSISQLIQHNLSQCKSVVCSVAK